ncbi:MAG: CocE/NonD family hydrolase [Promethearchaeota archaeon]
MNNINPLKYDEKIIGRPKYKGYFTESLYIQVRDGVKIATEVYLPKSLSSGEKFPAVLIQTRYWRAIKIRAPFKWFRKEPFDPKTVKVFTSYGFAVVTIDVRGCGASLGTRPYPFSEEEVKDGKEIIEWIVNQEWSDGNVVSYGNSYLGMTAEYVSVHNHPAVKGCAPKHNPWDPFRHAVFPGGCLDLGFITYWSNLGKAQDQNPKKALLQFKPLIGFAALLLNAAVGGVKLVESDKNKTIFKKALRDHKSNLYPIDYLRNLTFRDDPATEEGLTIDKLGLFTYKEEIENSNLPFYCWGSWQDSATAEMVINRFLTLNIPQKAVIGDWNHIALKRANPFYSHKAKMKPAKKEQLKSFIQFFKECINGTANKDKILYYYTMGEEKWKKTNSWPLKNQILEKWYFSENNLLLKSKPKNESGKDIYTINYSASTGLRNRWYTLLSLPVNYPNRNLEDKKLLVYTSPPLKSDTEITGHPILTLYMSSTHEDGAIFAYLEFIDLNENVKHITEGQLRVIHRKISNEDPLYKTVVPYHSYKKEDYMPLIPGEIAEIKFGLLPTSILLPKGYKIRIAIAGADKDSFDRYPKEGNPTISIERNRIYASNIELPIIPK